MIKIRLPVFLSLVYFIKIIINMKLKTLLILLCTIQVFANSYAQDKSFASLDNKNNEELFASVSRQTISLNQLAGYTIANATVVVQQKNVTGRVTDSNGNPLPGATIIEKGTTN